SAGSSKTVAVEAISDQSMTGVMQATDEELIHKAASADALGANLDGRAIDASESRSELCTPTVDFTPTLEGHGPTTREDGAVGTGEISEAHTLMGKPRKRRQARSEVSFGRTRIVEEDIWGNTVSHTTAYHRGEAVGTIVRQKLGGRIFWCFVSGGTRE